MDMYLYKYLGKVLGLIGESQFGKTWQANLLQQALRSEIGYAKRPLVIGGYAESDYKDVSHSQALISGDKAHWSYELKKRVEDRLCITEDLSIVQREHGKKIVDRLEIMFLRRRFDLMNLSQTLLPLKKVLTQIHLFSFFGLPTGVELWEVAVHSAHAVKLRELVKNLPRRQYVVVDTTSLKYEGPFSNDDIKPLVNAFLYGISNSESYVPMEGVHARTRKDVPSLVLEAVEANPTLTPTELAEKLGLTPTHVNKNLSILRRQGRLDKYWRG